MIYQASTKNIVIINDIPGEMRLFGDSSLIGEAVLNILSNAVKFTMPGGTITLHSPSSRVITVKDTWIGVEPSLLPDLFKHEVGTNHFPRHRGGKPATAWISSSAAALWRPMAARYGWKPHRTGRSSFSNSRGKNQSFWWRTARKQNGLKELLLSPADIEVFEAENGIETLELIMETKPILVITDRHLPVVVGRELVKRVRETHTLRNIPIVLCDPRKYSQGLLISAIFAE